MQMQLIHYSPEPLARVKDRSQDEVQLENRGAKPHGLWVSVGDEWKRFFQATSYLRSNAKAIAYETEILLVGDANCCRIQNVAELDALTAEYGTISERTKDLPSSRARLPIFDWPRLALHFDAIVISPLIAERQAPEHWYCSWDVASGCVWRARAVAEIRPLNY